MNQPTKPTSKAIRNLLGDDIPAPAKKASKAKPETPAKPGKAKLVPFSTQLTEENARHMEQYLYYAPGTSTGKKTKTVNDALAAFFSAHAQYAHKEIPE